MIPPRVITHVSVPPIPWRPAGQVRTAPTAPMVGGPRKQMVCPPPTRPNQRGTSWQMYNAPCIG
jgi:hypothetical protein